MLISRQSPSGAHSLVRIRRWLALAPFTLVMAMSAILPACRGSRSVPNILLITMDTTRADHLGAYGCKLDLTPSLDRLAAEGCVFEQAYTPCPITLPAHASLFTGRWPFEHGLRVNGESRLPTEETTLAEHLRARGYDTAAFIAAFVLDSIFGLDQGFDLYDDAIETPVVAGQNRLLREHTAEVVAARAISWLRSRTQRPWFCWIHFFDPHYPYHARPETFGSRFENSPYQAEIAYMDIHIGRVLDELRRSGSDRNTLIIAVADHGENLGEHGEMQHGLTLYQSAVRVPLIMRWPRRIPPGARVATLVSLVDIVPTVLDATGIPTNASLSGRSLWPILRGQKTGAFTCYMETHMPYTDYGWSPLAGLVADEWKYIRAPRPELYRLTDDPAEQYNLVHEEAAVAAQLCADLDDALERATATPAAGVRLSAEQRQTLLSLGYVGGHGPAPAMFEWAQLPDVKDMLPFVQMANDVQTLLEKGRAAAALTIAEDLARRDPQNAQFQLLLATALGAVGRMEEAAPILRGLIARGRDRVTLETYCDAAKLLAACRERQGDRAGAEQLLRTILKENPDHVEALNGLAWLLATAPDTTPEQAREALTLSRQAVGATGRQDASYLDTFAAACAAAGLFNEAISAAEEGRRVAAKEGNAALVASIADRIQLYRAGRRYISDKTTQKH